MSKDRTSVQVVESIRALYTQGVRLVPVREEKHAGKIKSPFFKWNKNDLPNGYDLIDLMDKMFEKDTNSVAMLLGSRSDNLVCLDIDSKYKPGFDAILFSDLKQFYPHLYEKFKIERTPSGGYHILYRIDFALELPGCSKAASRAATEEEIRTDEAKIRDAGGKGKPSKTRCFLEIKCEGGLSGCYPSAGYEKVLGESIETLSWEEHCSIEALCKSYNEVLDYKYVKAEKGPTDDIYEENPFVHFNRSEKGDEILKEYGWNPFRETASYIYYERPEKKGSKDVHASFNKEKRFFIIFTTSSGLEVETPYSPSNLLAALEYGGDKKKLYAHLVSHGYGTIKKSFEKQIIKKRIQDGAPLPQNVSEAGIKEYEELKEKFNEQYPYGTFWTVSETGVIHISREDVYRVSGELGFSVHAGEVCYTKGNRVHKLTENDYFNRLKEYIGKEEDVEVFNSYESFLQNSGKFTISRLPKFDTELLLKSSKMISYKFYQNCWIKVTKDGVESFEYDTLEKLIWDADIKLRDFEIISEDRITKGIYHDFLDKAVGVDDYLKKCIGYYTHDYRDEEGYFILTTEQCENPREGAGAGKNVFWSMLGLATTAKSTPASMIKKDNQLLQSWNGERLFVLADMPNHFDLIFFKDIITGNAVVRKLYKDEYQVPIDEMCKIGGSSNYSFDDTDPGVARRVRLLEFTDYFTKKGVGGVKKEYGKMFPKDWDKEDYLSFDNFIVKSIQEYLKADCSIEKTDITASGWAKQFTQKYSHLYQFFKDNMEVWVQLGRVSLKDFVRDYDDYKRENGIFKVSYSSQKINQALKDYCTHYGILFKYENVVWRDGVNVKGRYFGPAYIKDKSHETVKEEDEDLPF